MEQISRDCVVKPRPGTSQLPLIPNYVIYNNILLAMFQLELNFRSEFIFRVIFLLQSIKF